MFTSWMQQCLNYAFIVILTVGVLLIMNEVYLIVIENALNQGIDGVDIGTVAPILCVGITSFLILKQVPNIASALGGGLALATQNRVSEITSHGVNRFGSSARSAWSRLSSHRQSTNSIKG
jgi:type IV secretion system protein VirB6